MLFTYDVIFTPEPTCQSQDELCKHDEHWTMRMMIGYDNWTGLDIDHNISSFQLYLLEQRLIFAILLILLYILKCLI